jgi:hypothetical protein
MYRKTSELIPAIAHVLRTSIYLAAIFAVPNSIVSYGQSPQRTSNSAGIHSTPQDTLRIFRRAVRESNWRQEFECYAETLQVRFSYMIVQATRELIDEPQLAKQANEALEKHDIPLKTLDSFPSLRQSGRETDATEFQLILNRRLAQWRRDVFPNGSNWPELIEELQPLLLENYRRHQNEALHPCQNGIVMQLGYHLYLAESEMQVQGDSVRGFIVAEVRDTTGMEISEQDSSGVRAGDDLELDSGRSRWLTRLVSYFEPIRVMRPKAPVALVRIKSEWKIETIPYR